MSALDEYPLGDIKFQAAMILAHPGEYKGAEISPPPMVVQPDEKSLKAKSKKLTFKSNGRMTKLAKRKAVVSVVCKYFDQKQQDVLSINRQKKFYRPRAIIYHIMSTRLEMSTTLIGIYFKRDHTSIMNGLTKQKADKWGDNYKLVAINAELDVLFGDREDLWRHQNTTPVMEAAE